MQVFELNVVIFNFFTKGLNPGIQNANTTSDSAVTFTDVENKNGNVCIYIIKSTCIFHPPLPLLKLHFAQLMLHQCQAVKCAQLFYCNIILFHGWIFWGS